MKEITCGNCENLKTNKIGKMLIFYCGENDFVVPHEACSVKGEVKFWRVPSSCPRPSSDVFKSEKQASRKDWVIKSFKEF